MPDLDRLPRGVARGWGKVVSAVEGRQPPVVVADAVEKALAKTLRICGDLSWLHDLDSVVAICQASGSSEPLEAYIHSLDLRITRGIESAFIDVARLLAVSDDSRVESVLTPGLLRMVDKLCLGPIGPNLVPAVFSDYAQLEAYTDVVRELVDTAAIADRLVKRRFDASALRAPRTRLERPGTAELIHAPIV